MKLVPTGIIHSPYKTAGDAPRQGRLKGDLARVEIFEHFLPCLKDIETASHLIIMYWADRADRTVKQNITPFNNVLHGVFATRSPNRPNPINLNVVELISREDNILVVKGMDALDQSPLIDIKPYSAELDCVEHAQLVWRGDADVSDTGKDTVTAGVSDTGKDTNTGKTR